MTQGSSVGVCSHFVGTYCLLTGRREIRKKNKIKLKKIVEEKGKRCMRVKERGRRIRGTRAAKKEKKNSSSTFSLTFLCLPSSHIPYAFLKQGIPFKFWYLHTSLYSVLTVKTNLHCHQNNFKIIYRKPVM